MPHQRHWPRACGGKGQSRPLEFVWVWRAKCERDSGEGRLSGGRYEAAITGFSLRTPLGDEIDTLLSRLYAGERAASINAHFDAHTYPCHLASTLRSSPKPTKHRKFVKRMGLFGMEVGAEALSRSGLSLKGPRLGLFCGYGGLRAHWEDLMPVLEKQEGDERATDAWAKGFSILHPFWMLSHLSNNAHALLSIDIGAKGDGTTTAGANAGAQALCAAIHSLAVGAVDAALVFAYDSLVEPETILSLGISGAATSAMDPNEVIAPYDKQAAGFVPAEAACALVLERSSEAIDRAMARISVAALGDGSAGFPKVETLERALAQVWQGETILDGIALANPAEDAEERARMAKIMGEQTTLIAIAAAIGQMGGATAPLQAILLAHCLKKGMLPPIAGLKTPAEGPLKPLLQAEPTRAKSAVALSAGQPGLASALRVEIP
jgi:3-oxoacyl-(acyl-carrier-protein) synthase